MVRMPIGQSARIALLTLFLVAGAAGAAQAVPSYARQTGLACEACHTVFPQLTPFGRVFKASGYTISNTSRVQDIDRIQHYVMSLSNTPPLSAMVIASTSSMAKAGDPDSSTQSTDLPQEMSLFYAGEIADNVGAFIQITYDGGEGAIGIDNTDIRFADVTTWDGHSVVYGLSLNNNPTIQDLWNSTPGWGPPFTGSPALIGPDAAARMEDAMAQAVAGLTAYTFIDQSIYGEAGVYRSALQGASVTSDGIDTNDVISGVAPYWRFAYEYDWGQNSWEFGTFGMEASLRNPTGPGGSAVNISLQTGPSDQFTDVGLDSQYQYIGDNNQITVTGRWLHEDQKLDATYTNGFADNPSNYVNTYNLVGSYFWQRRIGASIGFFGVEGSNDPTYFGSVTGRPNSSWGNFEVDYLPWLNVKLGLQYTAYSKFNGATSNYDGSGRNASDNNLLYAYVWIAY
jgi:hypothetical protein